MPHPRVHVCAAPAGSVRRVPCRIRLIAVACAGALALTIVWSWQLRHVSAAITVDSTQRYQTIRGWEATAWAGQDTSPYFSSYRDTVAQQAVDALGITRLRLEIKAGAENPTDYWSLYHAGTISTDEWRAERYTIINDNASASTLNPSGFHFSALDFAVDSVVLPVERAMKARGQSLYLNLCYVDFGSSAFEHADHPDEYAEFMSATFHHLQDTYGLVPNAIEVKLEPDNGGGWSAADAARAIVAAGDRLKAEGFSPDFIGPSTTALGSSASWFGTMVSADPRVLDYLTELSYHQYDSAPGNANASGLRQAATMASAHGIATSMLERIGADYHTLQQDLKEGNVSAWQQYTLAGPSDNGAQYFLVDLNSPNPTVTLSSRARYLQEYFRNIRPGAQRIGASSTDGALDPVAFINPDGSYVVVIIADAAGSATLTGMPAGDYRIEYTTDSELSTQLPLVHVGDGGLLQASIPDAGVIVVQSAPEPASLLSLLAGLPMGIRLARRRRSAGSR